jgi:hypothetical protein
MANVRCSSVEERRERSSARCLDRTALPCRMATIYNQAAAGDKATSIAQQVKRGPFKFQLNSVMSIFLSQYVQRLLLSGVLSLQEFLHRQRFVPQQNFLDGVDHGGSRSAVSSDRASRPD